MRRMRRTVAIDYHPCRLDLAERQSTSNTGVYLPVEKRSATEVCGDGNTSLKALLVVQGLLEDLGGRPVASGRELIQRH
jgi:hypothetical protein